MKSLPTGLPPLPSGYVYLGLGGSFKLPPYHLLPIAAAVSPEISETCWRIVENYWSGDSSIRHYAAPADSEIVRLNTPAPLDLSKLPIGTRLRRRDGSVGVLITGSCFSESTYRVANTPRINDYTVHFSDGRCNCLQTTDRDIFEILPDETPSDLTYFIVQAALTYAQGQWSGLDVSKHLLQTAGIRPAEIKAVLKDRPEEQKRLTKLLRKK